MVLDPGIFDLPECFFPRKGGMVCIVWYTLELHPGKSGVSDTFLFALSSDLI